MTNGNMRRRSGGVRPGLFLGALVVVLVALFLPGWFGGLALLAIVGAMAWLMTRTWTVTPPQSRALRLIILLLLAGIAMYKIRH